MAFPWPEPRDDRIRALIAAAHEIGDALDHGEIEERRWIGDRVIRRLGDAGLCGLYVPERYDGQGLSQTGYARVFETFAQIDTTLSIILGVHQSIGFKAIVMFGTRSRRSACYPIWRGAGSWPASRSPSRTPARTPTTSNRAPCSSPTAPG